MGVDREAVRLAPHFAMESVGCGHQVVCMVAYVGAVLHSACAGLDNGVVGDHPVGPGYRETLVVVMAAHQYGELVQSLVQRMSSVVVVTWVADYQVT